MKRRMLPVLLLPLALLVAGCLERDEEIVIHADGSAEVTLTYKGDPGDFDELLTFPGDGWAVEKRTEAVKTDKGTSEQRVWTAKRTFKDLNDLPDCFAPAGAANRDRLLHATTKLTVRQAAGRRVYEFERTWPQTVSGDTQRVDEALINGPEMKPLLEKLNKGGLASLSEAETKRFFQLAAASEIEKQMVLAERVVEAWGRRHGAGFEERALLLSKINGVYREALNDANVTEAVRAGLKLPEEQRLNFAVEFLTKPRRAAIAACEALDAVKQHGGFADAYQSEDLAVRVGASLNDDHFKLRIRFTGPVVAGNATADPGDANVATWEFDGKELQDHAVTLRAVAMENGR